MTLLEKLSACADAYSKNKATNKAYKQIFALIFRENIILQNNNEFGYSEIDCREFKAISWRKYKDILLHLYSNDLIFTNIPLKKSPAGRKSIGGESIVRGYKIDRSILDGDIFEFCHHEGLPDLSKLDNSLGGDNFVTIQNWVKSILSMQKKNQSSSSSIKGNSQSKTNTLSIPFNTFPIPLLSMGGDKILLENGHYNILKIYDYIDIDLTKIPYPQDSEEWNKLAQHWNNHAQAHMTLNRISSWFHYIHSCEREIFTINGSHLREAFDIPACNFCIIAKLLEKTDVDKKELAKFQNTVKYQYIYKLVADHAGIEFTDIIKQNIKDSCQSWLNVRKCKRHVKTWTDKYYNLIDEYFKSEFPAIYDKLIDWREITHKNHTSKALWNDFQEVEFDIVSNKMCTYLYNTYNVTPATVHDALYITDADMEKITESIEDIFWKMIDFKYLNYKEETITKEKYDLATEKIRALYKEKKISQKQFVKALEDLYSKYYDKIEDNKK